MLGCFFEEYNKESGYFGIQLRIGHNSTVLLTKKKSLYVQIMTILRRLCLQCDFSEKYVIYQPDLGTGAFARVCKVKHRFTRKFFAAKIYEKTKMKSGFSRKLTCARGNKQLCMVGLLRIADICN